MSYCAKLIWNKRRWLIDDDWRRSVTLFKQMQSLGLRTFSPSANSAIWLHECCKMFTFAYPTKNSCICIIILCKKVSTNDRTGYTSTRYPNATQVSTIFAHLSLGLLLVLLADVNSRSRSLYAIADPSVVCRLSVCLSVCRLWRWCTLLRRLNFSAIFFTIR